MMIITSSHEIDSNGDGTRDKTIETFQRWENGLLQVEAELTDNPLWGQFSSWGAEYAYDMEGREVFREEQVDHSGGGIPQVSHTHSSYGPGGFLAGTHTEFFEWANPDNVVFAEEKVAYSYREDGQPLNIRTDWFTGGFQSDIDWREETWTYNDWGKVESHVIEDYNVFNVPVSRFYTYNSSGQLRNIKLQDEIRFGDERPRIVETFSYNKDGSMKEKTDWGIHTEFGWATWQQTQFTHVSPAYDKITTLIDLTGDFKFEFKVVEDTWRNAEGQDTHILTSRYDATGNLLGRDLITQVWDEYAEFGPAERYVDIGNDGVFEEVFTRSVTLPVADLMVA
jgi:hypothetical protein